MAEGYDAVVSTLSNNYKDYRKRQDSIVTGISEKIDKYRKQDVSEIRKALDATTPKNIADRACYNTQQEYFRIAPQVFNGDNYASDGYMDVMAKSRPLVLAIKTGYAAAATEATVREARDYFTADNGKNADELSDYMLNGSSSNQIMATYGKNPNDKSMTFEKYDAPDKINEIEKRLDDFDYSVDECAEMLKSGTFAEGCDPEFCAAYVKNYDLIQGRKQFREDIENLKTGNFGTDLERSQAIKRLSDANDMALLHEGSTVRFKVSHKGTLVMDIDSFDYGEHVFSELKSTGRQKDMVKKLDSLDVTGGQTHILDTLSDDMGSVVATDSFQDMKSKLYNGKSTLETRMMNHKIAKALAADEEGAVSLMKEAHILGGDEATGALYHDMVSQHALRLDYHVMNDADFRTENAAKLLESRANMLSRNGDLRKALDALKIDESSKDIAMDHFTEFLQKREDILGRFQDAGLIRDHVGANVTLDALSSTEDVKAVLTASATGVITLQDKKGRYLDFEGLGKQYGKYQTLIKKGVEPSKMKPEELDLCEFFNKVKDSYGVHPDLFEKDMLFIMAGGMNGREGTLSGVAQTMNSFYDVMTNEMGGFEANGILPQVLTDGKTGLPLMDKNGNPLFAPPAQRLLEGKDMGLTDMSARVKELPELIGKGFGDQGDAAYRELFQGYIGSLAVVSDKNKIVYTSYARLDNMAKADKSLVQAGRMNKGYTKGMIMKPMRQDENMNQSLNVSGRVKDVGSLAYRRTLSKRVNMKLADKFFSPMSIKDAERGVAEARRALKAASGAADKLQKMNALKEAEAAVKLAKFETETYNLARAGSFKSAITRKGLGMGRYNTALTKVNKITKPIVNVLKKPGALARKVVMKVLGSGPIKLLGGALLSLIKLDLLGLLMCAPVILFCGIVDFGADKVQSAATAVNNFFSQGIMPGNFEADPFRIEGFLEMFRDFNDDFTSKSSSFRKLDDNASTMFDYGDSGETGLRYFALAEMMKGLKEKNRIVNDGMTSRATRAECTIYFMLHEDDEGGPTHTIRAADINITSDKDDHDEKYQKLKNGKTQVVIDDSQIPTTENFRELVCMLTAAMQYDFVNCPYEVGDFGEGDEYKGEWTAAKMKMLIRLIYKTTHWYYSDFNAWLSGGQKGNIRMESYVTPVKEKIKHGKKKINVGYYDSYYGTLTKEVEANCDTVERVIEERLTAQYDEIIHMYVLKGSAAWAENIIVPGEAGYHLNSAKIKEAIVNNTAGFYENEEPWQLNPDGTPVTQTQKQAVKDGDGNIVKDSEGNVVYEDVEVPVTYVGWSGEFRDTKIFENDVKFEAEMFLPDEPDIKEMPKMTLYNRIWYNDDYVSYEKNFDGLGRVSTIRETYYDGNGKEIGSRYEEYHYDTTLEHTLKDAGKGNYYGVAPSELESMKNGYSDNYMYGWTTHTVTTEQVETDSDGKECDVREVWTEEYSIETDCRYSNGNLIQYYSGRWKDNDNDPCRDASNEESYTLYTTSGSLIGGITLISSTERTYHDAKREKLASVLYKNNWTNGRSSTEGDVLKALGKYASWSYTSYYEKDGSQNKSFSGSTDGGDMHQLDIKTS